MIVCSCHAISDSELRLLAHGGASVQEIALQTSAGTSCGCCVPQVREVVAEVRGGCGKSPACPGCKRHAAAA
jgi:bacterioferritin-associated ferredoxin